jgi:UDP-N-acetylmuramyl pentapeptide phosphotransferase/UDP-N-acetylglucosamine-1-phosphate transferase
VLEWLAAFATAVIAFVLVGVVRRIALAHGVLDHPGDRSSHVVPTPRGGGLGLLIAALGMWTWQATLHRSWPVLLVVLGASVVALVGWVDDRRGLPVRTRLAVHVAAGALVGAIAATGETSVPVSLGLFAWWTFWTVSSINLVNFMDGINGLVAAQIAVFALSLALPLRVGDPTTIYALTLAAACIGFLPWNVPRAKIFLGDVGSGGLGFLSAGLALLAIRAQGVDIVRAQLPLLPLFGDATWTIFRRWRRGERLTQAHRSHLYQRLANGRLSHTAVTAIYTLVALAGAVVAHLGRGTMAWPLGYAAFTLLLGIALDRFASSASPARA